MGNCKYCGKPVGLLKIAHKECEVEHQRNLSLVSAGEGKMIDEIDLTISNGKNLTQLDQTLSSMSAQYAVPPGKHRDLLVKGWEKCVDRALEDGILDLHEEQRLMAFMQHFVLTQAELNLNGSFMKVAQAAVLRDVLEGKVPQRAKPDSSLGINFQKGEQFVWRFKGVKYYEDKTKRQTIGRTQGVSIRVMKGVYYRVGQFKGTPVETTARTLVDTGDLVITSKNIYFSGPSKSVRVPYEKIVSFHPYKDGFGLMKDTTTAMPQTFVTGDGWFVFNLVSNLSQL
jgi:hypothetical protein